jgi:precorrin-6B methylase 2
MKGIINIRLRLLVTLIDIHRIPVYLGAILYALSFNILKLRFKFYGMITLPECVELHKIARKLPNKSVIVEIGCFGGLATAYILSGCKKSCFVYSIDPFASDIPSQKKIVMGYKNRNYREAEKVSLNNKPSKRMVSKKLKSLGFKNFQLIEGFSDTVVKKWKRTIDLLWIDGNHEYEAVKNDFFNWSPYIRKGGSIVFHDANKKDGSNYWKWGLRGPSKVVNKYINLPMWKIDGRIDSMVHATKTC